MVHPLKTWRLERSYSQPEAAKELGVDAMTVSRWERGEHLPHRDQWSNIETKTGIPMAAFIDHVKQPQQADAEPAQ